jgi:pentatricopeptide repeat protein
MCYMRFLKLISLLVILNVSFLCLSGCCILKQNKQEITELPEKELHLSRQDVAFARALANYASGILNQNSNPGHAVTNYLNALKLSPGEQVIYTTLANYYFQQKKPDKAVEIMEQACEENPSSFTAHLRLAMVAEKAGQLDKARQEYKKAVKLEPENYKPYIQLSSIYLKQGNQTNAFACLEQCLGQVENKTPVYRLLGDLHAQKQKAAAGKIKRRHLEQAIHYYQQADTPPHDELWLAYLERLADVCVVNNNIKQAVNCLNTILKHRPDNVEIQKKLILCYIQDNKRRKAVELLKKLEKQQGENPEIQYYLGQLYEKIGDKKQAIFHLTNVCEAGPSNPMPYLQLAALYGMNEPEKAIQTLKTGLKYTQESPRLLEFLAQMYHAHDQLEKSLKAYRRLETIVGETNDEQVTDFFIINYAAVARERGLNQKAMSLYKKAISQNTFVMQPYIELASLYLEESKENKAIETMEKAVQIMPDNPFAQYYLGVFYNFAREFDRALRQFKKTEQTAEHFPDIFNADFYYNYGAACERTGDFVKAEELLHKSIKLDPENANALNYLAYMWAEQNRNLDLGLIFIRHALDNDPENGAFLDTQAWLYYKKKDYDKALEIIKWAIFFINDDPKIAEHMGDILYALKEPDQAGQWWLYSLKLDSRNQELKEKMLLHNIEIPQPLSNINQ